MCPEGSREQTVSPSRCPPTVGIGASAGGIPALQSFFAKLPEQVGAAFVVVVHLDPQSQSELPAILAARTRMPVTQVSEPVGLQADHVYVIPPNRNLRITDNQVAAAEFDEPRGLRTPIDRFFRSLAEAHGDGVAILLSGAGSDGTVGVKAIKESGGIIMVQDPMEAEYPSMPSSAIATGVADLVLPIAQMPARLVELLRAKRATQDAGRLRLCDEETLRRILAHIRVRTGQDFSQYKRATVLRRLARRPAGHPPTRSGTIL